MRASELAITAVAGLLAFGPLEATAQVEVGRVDPTPPRPPAVLVLQPPPEGKVQRITLSDGTQLVGRIVEVTDSIVKFESNAGSMSLHRALIKKIRLETPGTTRDGRYYFPNPNTTRLFFAPTGRMLGEGEGYFADHWVVFPSIALGVSSNFTVGGGMSVIPEISPADQLWFFTPKIGIIQSPRFNFAIGALAAGIPSDGDGTTVGVLYGVGTWGAPDATFTAGLGYGFENGDLARRPVVMLGGETRASPKVSFVTENHLMPGGTLVWSGGVRFFGPGIALDFAALGIKDSAGDGFCCVPWLGVMLKW